MSVYNAIWTLLEKYLKRTFIEKGGFAVKVDHQLNLFAKSAKLSREKEASELSVRIQSISRDRVN